MDLVCQRMLNQGFLKVERYHNLCQKQVKAQLPRYVQTAILYLRFCVLLNSSFCVKAKTLNL